jgi:hypothetical protein
MRAIRAVTIRQRVEGACAKRTSAATGVRAVGVLEGALMSAGR